MKKTVLTLLAAFFAAAGLFAQTTDEILARMEQERSRMDTEGTSMVMEMKIPLLGSFATTIYMLGDKYKMVTDVRGETSLNWSDGVTDWAYDAAKNQVTITNASDSGNEGAAGNTKMLDAVTEGYDVTLKKETDEAWYFRCTRSRTNTNKDDPKAMDLVVSKATYLPLSISAREKGVTVILRDFAMGVSEADITFNPADYPGATIIDNRK